MRGVGGVGELNSLLSQGLRRPVISGSLLVKISRSTTGQIDVVLFDRFPPNNKCSTVGEFVWRVCVHEQRQRGAVF